MHFVYGFCNGYAATAVKEYQLWYPRRQISDRCVHSCSPTSGRKRFLSECKHHAECQVQRNVEEDENIIDMVKTLLTWSSVVHALVQEEFLCSVHESPANATCIRNVSIWHPAHSASWTCGHVCSWLDLCCWINSNSRMIHNILFTDEAHYTHDGVNTRNSNLWDRDNPHGTVESNYQHRFSINVWCGVVSLVANWLVCTFSRNVWQVIFTPAFCRWTASMMERFCKMNCQHDGALLHFSQVVRQYLNHKFPSGCIGLGGAQNWPSQSLDLNSLDYHVWGYMKAMVYAHKVNPGEELLQWILSAAESINSAAMLRKVTSSLVTRVRKCIQSDGGHFEQFAGVLNSESVIVHLTT